MKIKFSKKVALSILLCAGALFVSTESYAQAALGKAASAAARVLKKGTPALTKAATSAATTSARTTTAASGAYWAGGAAVAGAYAGAQQRSCSTCGGARVVSCGGCGGTGQRMVVNQYGYFVPVTCMGCGGSGRVACPSCR